MTTTAAPVTPAPPARVPGRDGSVPRALLGAPFRSDTWRASGYLLVRIPLATLGFALVPLFAASAVLSVTVVGIPLVALVLLGARGLGGVQRRLTRRALAVRIGDPAPLRSGPGAGRRVASAWGDAVGWRALAYLFASFPVIVAGGYAVVVWTGLALSCVSYPIWWSVGDISSDGPDGRHQGLQLAGLHVDTWGKALVLAAVGLVVLWLAPWLVRGVVALDVVLQRWLLTGSAADRRVAALESARAEVVEDAAATLRRVERDLHDGTQAQLVAVAMGVDRARSRLAAGDAPGAAALLDGAHGAAKEALADLREVVRRIHPPVLDQGLPSALHTLAARCALPVRLEADVPVRPEPGLETIAYFCVAELLTNAVRHSGGCEVEVTVRGDARGDLDVTVRDDGRGGAVTGAPGNDVSGTGLAGLAARVRAVDGRFEIDSPDGGPTVVRFHVPSRGHA